MRRRLPRLALVAATSALALSTLAGCAGFNPPGWADPNATASAAPVGSATPTATCSNFGFESLFSAYGSVHYSYVLADNLTLYIDMYTEQKTHEWYASTNKQLDYVIRVVDTNAREEDPFKLKRKVYMGELKVTADTVEKDGATVAAYTLDDNPVHLTLDPEALQSKKYGLLITSPKGGFQYEHTEIGALPDDTYGLNMDFALTLSAQTAPGKKDYQTSTLNVTLPIAIFSPETQYASTSCATNNTMDPSYAPGVTP